ncbi:BOS complex subunit NOMO3 [Bacillus rossius redtenbacheri]|uniref:BOS complex subunit NOMO3 n=1 Tax=Bacillus rossius redtenbacheri TaxID=93214 RepID=UPI002FDE593D
MINLFDFVKFVSLVVFVFSCVKFSSSQDILGCGGFVKSDVDINFSEVEVKLFTKHGALKDQIDCAPNNGYYFLPLYDKGEYVLKIAPPSGWLFEPKEVVLNVDGITDPCSQGKDINFVFKGFAILGKVVSAGSENGPKDVAVSLFVDGKSLPLHEVATTQEGKFVFSPVLPGKYSITASHPHLKFNKSRTSVQVGQQNAEIPSDELVVSGYDVYGTVTSNDEPIRGVSFVLFQEDNKPPPSELDACSTTPLAGFKSNKNSLCHVISDERGVFHFRALPPGKYKVVPHYESPTNIHFDVRPEKFEFEVTHNSIVIDSPFKVTGFSVKGRVLMKENGNGIQDATLLLDGRVSSRTSASGEYYLENMQPGTYSLQVKADDLMFSTENVKITANTPQLPDIYPTAYKVCGVVKPYRLIHSSEDKLPLAVLFSNVDDDQKMEVQVEAGSGKICQFLKRGNYKVSVVVSEELKNKWLQFSPLSKTVKVLDSPILDAFKFIQLKVKLSGKVLCLPVAGDRSCPEIKISLHRVSSDAADKDVLSTLTKGAVYIFEDILPGAYTVSITKDEWCWESTSHVVNVTSSEYVARPFVQTGFVVNFYSSHATEVQYELQSSQSGLQTVNKLFVEKGHTKTCVTSPGVYKFKPVGCHEYDQPVFQWNSAAVPTAIHMNAISHAVSGRVTSTENVNDIVVTVTRAENENSQTRLGPLKPKVVPEKKMVFYEFRVQLRPGETVTFEPSASSLLFRPTKIVFEGLDDCVDNQIQFEADLGKIIEGKVVPALPGVKISVFGDDAKEKLITSADTKEDGSYRFGPLPGTVNYQIIAEKEGYVMSKRNSDGNFHAHKLAEIIVEVTDKADGKHLQGVLLSLSGGESFRRNSQTGSEGRMTFSSLSPGDYFLRPMLKEYSFEPASKMISVREGETTEVKLIGRRVAYSVFGTVTSLSGEPERGVVVEAVGTNNCSLFQEESTTETNGHFRIRGLKPNCAYVVRMKQGREVNQHVQRVTPKSVTVTALDGDIHGIKLIAFHAIKQMDISAYINSSDMEHLHTVNAKLCREDSPDMPVHTIKMEALYGKSSLAKSTKGPLIVFPSIPLDNRGYFILLESTLSPKSYHRTTDKVHFKANTSFKHLKLAFQPVHRYGDVHIGHCSYYVIPLATVLFLIYYHQQKIFPVMNRFVRRALKFTKIAGPHSGRQGNNSGSRASNVVTRHSAASDHGVNDVVLVEAVNVKRKVKPRLI